MQYEEAKADLLAVRNKAEKAKIEAERKSAAYGEKKQDKEEHQAGVNETLAMEQNLETTITSDCAWVDTHFESRRTDRKAEIDGLQDAKAALSLAEQGDFDQLAIASAGAGSR